MIASEVTEWSQTLRRYNLPSWMEVEIESKVI